MRNLNKDFFCTLCNKYFKNYNNLWRHAKRHENTLRFQCHDCDATFADKSSLTGHVLNHYEIKNYM